MYFTSISKVFDGTKFQCPDISKLHEFVDEQVPDSVYFRIPVISTHEVYTYLRKLNTTKSTGPDGIGPRILKLSGWRYLPIHNYTNQQKYCLRSISKSDERSQSIPYS